MVMALELLKVVVVETDGTTITTKLESVLLGPSLTVIVMVVEPLWPVIGLTEIVRFAPPPPKVMFPVGIRFGFEEVALNCKLAAAT